MERNDVSPEIQCPAQMKNPESWKRECQMEYESRIVPFATLKKSVNFLFSFIVHPVSSGSLDALKTI